MYGLVKMSDLPPYAHYAVNNLVGQKHPMSHCVRSEHMPFLRSCWLFSVHRVTRRVRSVVMYDESERLVSLISHNTNVRTSADKLNGKL
jgi:hypothetical protein